VAVIAALMEIGDHGVPRILFLVVVNGLVIATRSSDPDACSRKVLVS
jgi:hypothetical protein